MIRHCVMLRLAPEVDMNRLRDLCSELSALVDQLDGCSGFMSGPNRDFEGLSVGYPYGFTFDVQDSASLQAYADHPEHRALGKQLVAMCIGGVEGLKVYDLEMQP